MKLIGVGACYMDTVLGVSYYPSEDEKLRATDISHRRGGNVPNTLEVLQQLVHQDKDRGHAPPLSLCSVMPSASSVGSGKIKASFGPNVDLSHCLYREQCVGPASSYIIRSSSTGSRTIVNYNDLPEMTSAEFAAVADSFGSEAETTTWYHFECMQYLRRAYPTVKISVEVEKPGRAGLQELAAEADVVFYSKGWALDRGYRDSATCLRDQAGKAEKAYAHSPST
ncbi:hypothetical protein LTR20_002098 [Exophiala xenobiotica]|nr:hypothetical protein LTS06_012339 [Exophiala xenobiotica]KAK5314772.1 hypothetical protein LTR93_010155 [Exophiala xenobiotica]KAK5377637.1 hypothetical protein LTS13_004507 [Exophiala xenobiotica]KAK5400380.1 hypothetical protein LTR79_002481 [Exophiala xenobiotica]KAK5420685.1 hypothetical protein LTR90_003578 [Exophiala xenobiotica]